MSNESDRPRSFDCCGTIIKSHPVVTSAFLAIMGLAMLVIPAGAILGIVAFFRTI